MQPFKFFNYLKKPTTYTIRIDPIGTAPTPATGKPGKGGAGGALVDFSCDQNTINAPAADSKEGMEMTVNIKFEPSSVSEA